MAAASAPLSLLISNEDRALRCPTARSIHRQCIGGASLRKMLNFAMEDCSSQTAVQTFNIKRLCKSGLTQGHDDLRIAVFRFARNWSANSGTKMVWSRSAPVEIIPIFAPLCSSMNLR